MKSRQGLALIVVWGALAACAVLTVFAPKAPQPAKDGGLGALMLPLARTGF